MRAAIALSVGLLCAVAAPSVMAKPGSGPRETVDQSFTTNRPNSPTGGSLSGVYHAAGNPKGNPPYMRKLVFYPPRGMRYDTSVPDRCTASDLELELRGPEACPSGSRLGGGTVQGVFYEPIAQSFVIDYYQHPVELVNNTNEQIILVHSEGYTVVRGRIRPDQSIEFSPPTCFPAPPTGQCPRDYVVQLKSTSVIRAYTRIVRGRLRSYATTPPTCPARRYWRTRVKLWWADGSIDTVATDQPCKRPRSSRRRA